MTVIEVVSSPEVLTEAHALRSEVFVEEQGVPLAEEIDDADHASTTTHVVARSTPGGAVIGTARLLTDPGMPGVVHIGRVAVAASVRGSGVGARLMEVLEGIALARYGVTMDDGGARVRVELSAQVRAIGFYERVGYEVRGPVYLDAGIDHRDAAKTLIRGEPSGVSASGGYVES